MNIERLVCERGKYSYGSKIPSQTHNDDDGFTEPSSLLSRLNIMYSPSKGICA